MPEKIKTPLDPMNEREKELVAWFKELWLERFRNPKSISDVIPKKANGKYDRDFPIVTATEIRDRQRRIDPTYQELKSEGAKNIYMTNFITRWYEIYEKHVKEWKYEQLRKKEREDKAAERGPLD